jgi:hypothetical protein
MGSCEETSVTFFVQFDKNESSYSTLKEGFELYKWKIIQCDLKQNCYILSGKVKRFEIPYKLSKLGYFNELLILDNNQKQNLNSLLKTINMQESGLAYT